MRRLAALVLVAVLLVGVTAPAAYAGGNTGTNVALGLASFAVFNQLLAPLLYQRHAYAEPYHRQAYAEPVTVTRSIVYTTPVVYLAFDRLAKRARGLSSRSAPDEIIRPGRP